MGCHQHWLYKKLKVAMAFGLVGFCCVPLCAMGQKSYNYNIVSTSSHVFQPLGSTSSSVELGQQIIIPFVIPFFGDTIRYVYMSRNGYLLVNAGPQMSSSSQLTSENYAIPFPDNQDIPGNKPQACIAVWWAKVPKDTGTFKYEIKGAAPTRTVIFEWSDIHPVVNTTNTTSTNPLAFQVHLYETTGQIRFAYGSTTPNYASGISADEHIYTSAGLQWLSDNGAAALECSKMRNCGTQGTDYPASKRIDFFIPGDLIISAFSSKTFRGLAGDPYTLSAKVKNIGFQAISTNNATLSFFLSEDAVLDVNNDTRLATKRLGSLAPNAETSALGGAPTLPSTIESGQYAVIARVEMVPNITPAEWRTTNNESRALDVQIDKLAPNLIAKSITAPETATAGDILQVSRTIANEGSIASVSVPYTYFISDNAAVSTSDRALAPGRQLGVLQPGANVEESDAVAIPTNVAAGLYWLGICVNYDTTTSTFGTNESTILDNCVTSSVIRISAMGQLAIVTQMLPMITQHARSSMQLEAVGGTGEYTWGVNSGSTLPLGLALSTEGRLAGVPAIPGTYSFEVKVSSGTFNEIGKLSLTISQAKEDTLPLVIADQVLPTAELGLSYRTGIVASGGKPPYQWAVSVDSKLPAGFLLAPEGTLEGRGHVMGDYSFAVEVSDSIDATASKDLILNVIYPTTLTITTRALHNAYLARQYLQPLNAQGGQVPYQWELLRIQKFPSHLADEKEEPIQSTPFGNPIVFPENFGLKMIDDIDEVSLRGIPKITGQYALTMRVTDLTNATDTATVSLYILYTDALSITTTTLPDAFLNIPYNTSLSHSGKNTEGVNFTLPCIKLHLGMPQCVTALEAYRRLPDGLQLQATDGSISGTPSGPDGMYSFLVKISDVFGRQDVQGISIRVRKDSPPQEGGCTSVTPRISLLAYLVLAAFLRKSLLNCHK